MDAPPEVWASLLDAPPDCGERARRILRGARGQAYLNDLRFAVIGRVREDARLAHAELRAPQPADFPTADGLEPEQAAVYRAAARGYLALFPAPARALDAAIGVECDERSVVLRPPRDLVVETADGRVELRRLGAAGRRATIGAGLVHAIALCAAQWRAERVHVVAADLLALETAEVVVDVDATAVADAREWLATGFDELVERARRAARAGRECASCEFVWDCPVHLKPRA